MKLIKGNERDSIYDTIAIFDMNEFQMFSSMLAKHHYDKTTPTFARSDIIEQMWEDLEKNE